MSQPADVLNALKAGNQRYVAQTLQAEGGYGPVAQALTGGQAPQVAVLSCADSRVVPERVFDQNMGDLFVIRVAGNVCSGSVLASLEYAVGVLEVPLVVVLGHQNCGVVQAAVDGARLGTGVDALIEQAAKNAAAAGKDMDLAVRLHTQAVVQELKTRESALLPRLAQGTTQVVGGVYSLATGQVDFVA